MAKTIQIVQWLGQGDEPPTSFAPGIYNLEEGEALLAAEPRRSQVINRLATVGLGPFRAMTHAQATELIDSMVLSVYGAAKYGAKTQIPVIERRVKRAVLGLELGVMALGLAATILVGQAVMRRR